MDDKYLKAIEALGEIISLRDQEIKFKAYEVESLNKRIEEIIKKYEKS